MTITAFPNGVSSFGVPLVGGDFGRANGAKHYFVHGNEGNNGSAGTDPDRPLLTMERAFELVGSGDTIYVLGNIREQLDAPAGIFDVTILGAGNRPRHADAHTSNNGYQTATWKSPASPTAATPLLNLRQQGWRIVNLLWVPPTDAAAIALTRDAASGDSERDASHAEILGCRFAAGQDAIRFLGTEILHNVRIAHNVFEDATGSSIIGSSQFCRRALIEYNEFRANENHITCPMRDGTIRGNTFGLFTTLSVDISGGSGNNMVWGNYLSGTYASPQYAGESTDEWGGNFNSLTGGVTADDPA